MLIGRIIRALEPPRTDLATQRPGDHERERKRQLPREAFTVIDGALGEAYDPNAIYSGSQDQHGHSANLRLTIPKHWLATFSELVQSSEFPEYKSNQSIIRDAIYHRMHHVANMSRSIAPHIARAMAMDILETRSAQVREVADQADNIISDMRITLDQAIRHGDYEAARRLLLEYEETIEIHFPEPHLTRLMDEVDRYRSRLSR